MIFFKHHKKKAFGLLEIVIALVIGVAAAIPILKMVTSSRNETTSSINYLRAMELANEAIEWASVAKFDELENLENVNEIIIEDNGSSITPLPVDSTKINNDKWNQSDIFIENLLYSEQYSNAFFFRIIDVEPVSGGTFFDNDMLKRVTVTVKWSEGERPKNLNVDSEERKKQVQLSILVINDDNLYN